MGKVKETRPGVIYRTALASCRKCVIPPQRLTAGSREKSQASSVTQNTLSVERVASKLGECGELCRSPVSQTLVSTGLAEGLCADSSPGSSVPTLLRCASLVTHTCEASTRG